MRNKVKEKILNGEKIVGTVSHLGSGTAIECLGNSGMDFVVIDTEHGPFSYQDVMNYIRAAECSGITPFVRVPDYTRPSLHRAINCGAKGIIVPCIRSVAEVKAFVEEGKFFPKGNHCFPYARNSEWSQRSYGRLKDFFEEANDEVLLIPQCETMECLEHIEEIMAIDGIDGIFLGPYDLSTSMGIPGHFNDPEFLKARARIIKACQAENKVSVCFSPNVDAARKNLADGFSGVAINVDTVIFTNAYKETLAEILK